MKIDILPLSLYVIVLITIVYLTGISPEQLLILFPIGVFAAACWFIIPFFIGMLTARLSDYKLWVRALYASIASLVINFVLPFSTRRYLLYQRFDYYVSLRGFLSILRNGQKTYLICFLIVFLVFWAGEEVAYGCKKERASLKESNEQIQ